MKRILTIALSAAALLAILFYAYRRYVREPVVILSTATLQAQLIPSRAGDMRVGGMILLASALKTLRNETYKNRSLLLDAGNSMFQDYGHLEFSKKMPELLRKMQFDAITLGFRDFSIAEKLDWSALPPVLGCNVDVVDVEDPSKFKFIPSKLFVIRGVRIAVIGAVDPGTLEYQDDSIIQGVRVRNVTRTRDQIQKEADRWAKEKVDAIVLLSSALDPKVNDYFAENIQHINLIVGRNESEHGSIGKKGSTTIVTAASGGKTIGVVHARRALGTLSTAITLVRRGTLTPVDDKARRKMAHEILPDIEGQVKSSVSPALARASDRLDELSEKLWKEQDKSHDLVKSFHDQQVELRSRDLPGYTYLVVYVPAREVQPGSKLLAAPDFASDVPDVPKELVKHANAGVSECFRDGHKGENTLWMTSTPFGHLAVAACQQDKLGTLIAATLWDERAFLESTSPLWEGKHFGVSLIQNGERMTYTTETSEYGERKNQAEHLETGRVTEVRSGDYVEYVYQDKAKDQALFPGLTFRIRFPDNPKASLAQIIVSLLVLVGSLLLVGFLVRSKVIGDAAESRAEAS